MTVTHDLTSDELATLDGWLRTRDGRSSWRWITPSVGKFIYRPTLRMADGVIVEASARNDLPTSVIVRNIFDAEQRRHDRRAVAAKRAAVTRRRRRERKVYEAAQALRDNRLTSQDNCRICGRGLTDVESIARGIGSECWQDVLKAMTRERDHEQAAS